MTTKCPECGSEETSTIAHAGPRGGAVVKCFGECDGERHEVDDYEKPKRDYKTPANKQQDKPEQTTLSDW